MQNFRNVVLSLVVALVFGSGSGFMLLCHSAVQAYTRKLGLAPGAFLLAFYDLAIELLAMGALILCGHGLVKMVNSLRD